MELKKHRIQIDDIKTNSDLMIVWNKRENIYFLMKMIIFPHKNNIHDRKYDVNVDIGNKIIEFSKTQLRNITEEFPLFVADLNQLYTLKIEINRIQKKSIADFDHPITIKKQRFIDQEIIDIIQKAGDAGISATDLNWKTQSITKQQRNEILQSLIDDEIITVHFDQSKGRKKKIYKYE